MRIIFGSSLLLLSTVSNSSDYKWIYSEKEMTCKYAKFSPQQLLETGRFQVDINFEDKKILFLKGIDTNIFLLFASTKKTCNEVARSVQESKEK